MVAVDAITFGRDRFPSDLPGGQPVDGRLVQADQRARAARDQVQLVLDDQVRRPQRRDLLDPPGGLAALGRVLRGVAVAAPSSSAMVSAVT